MAIFFFFLIAKQERKKEGRKRRKQVYGVYYVPSRFSFLVLLSSLGS